MTKEEMIERLNANIDLIEQYEKPMVIAVKDTIATMAKRIFEDGLNSNGSRIGNYDERKELYVSDISLPRKGNNIGKRGKRIKTNYYKNYKELRRQQGRESSFVNLSLFGRLQSEFVNKPISVDGSIDGNVGEPIKTGELEYSIKFSDDGIKKYKNIEKKYGKIFTPTKDELENFANVFTFELLNALI